MKSLVIAAVFGAMSLFVSNVDAGPLRCLVSKVASVRPVQKVVTDVQPVRRTLRAVHGAVCSRPVKKVVTDVQPVRRTLRAARGLACGACCE